MINKTREEIRNLKEYVKDLRIRTHVLETIVNQITKGKPLPFTLKPFYMSKVDGKMIGDLMTIHEFYSHVKCGMFIDYDGEGLFATKDEQSDIRIKPSTFRDLWNYVDTDVLTHVVWFNK